jgi:hypothetical protein
MNMSRGGKRPLAAVLFLLTLAPVLAVAQVAWVRDFNAALRQAAQEKKFLVLDISASW